MKAKISTCAQLDINQAVQTISREIGDSDARLVIYFASSQYDPEQLAKTMASAFPGIPTVGCTTAGEISSGLMTEHSISAMSLGSEIVRRVEAKIIPNISRNPREQLTSAFEELSQSLGQKIADLHHEKFIGLVLVDGLSKSEEQMMAALGDLTNITFIGGAAGDDLQFKKTHIFVGPKAASDAAAIIVIEAATPFQILKTQSFRPMPQRLIATKVDERQRLVMEFNGQPAAVVYAKAIGVTLDKAPTQFMTHPLGLVAGDDIFVRSPQRIDGQSMYFYCSILEGMELALLEATDIVKDTQTAVLAIPNAIALLDFHCILRTLELRQKGQCTQYGAIFSKIPTIGFSTYGEEYIGHINQTSTMLVFQSR